MYVKTEDDWVCTHGVSISKYCSSCDKENGRNLLDRVERKVNNRLDSWDTHTVLIRGGVALGVVLAIFLLLLIF